MKIPVRPLRDRVVLEQLSASEETKTASGIILPATNLGDDKIKGKVIAVGLGAISENGYRIEPEVEVGEIIVFEQGLEDDIIINGKSYLVILEAEIIAVIDEDVKVDKDQLSLDV